jgi:hypothetical protein
MATGLIVLVVSVFATIGIWRQCVPPEAKDKLRVVFIALPMAMTLGIEWLYGNVTPQAKAQQILDQAVSAVDEGDTRQAIAILKEANERRSRWLGEEPRSREY